MDEWEWESDSEERDGEDYSEEQDQEEELDSFCEAGQLRTCRLYSRSSTAKLLASCAESHVERQAACYLLLIKFFIRNFSSCGRVAITIIATIIIRQTQRSLAPGLARPRSL